MYIAVIDKEAEKSPNRPAGCHTPASIGRRVGGGRGTLLSSSFLGWARRMNYVEGNQSVGSALPREDEDMLELKLKSCVFTHEPSLGSEYLISLPET